MTKVLFKRKTSDEIVNLPVEDGALIYNYETGATYLDYNDERITTGGGMPTGDTFPIGAITSYAGNTAPTNWLICDGSAISRTTYADLFDAIGTTYGVGDGSTTFNLPNLKGRVITGLDSSQTEFDTLGETGGEKAHTLTIAEMPSHKHNMRVKQNASGFSDGYPAGGNTYEYSNNEYPIQNTGGGQPHNNLQPYITLNYIIKAFQSSGTVANVTTTETNSDTDTYSCNYINEIKDGEVYSTTETKTNEVWIDDKPIYRKVLNIGTADFYSSTDNHFTHGIDDLDTMLNVTYSMYFPGDNCYYKQWDKIVTIKSSSTRVSFTTSSISGTYIRFTNVKIVLEYTKTTDT